MKKITLDFYGEKLSITFPKDFPSLMKEIEQNFQLILSEVFTFDISYIKNKVKKHIKSENDYKIFIISKVTTINLEIVELNDLSKNNQLNIDIKSKEDKAKLESLKNEKVKIKKKVHEKEKENKKKIEEYKYQIELLNQQKALYITKLQKEMKNQNKSEKDLVSKITQLAKEINAPLIFKLPEKEPLQVKGKTKKEKEYLELIKQYNDCLKIGQKLFSIPRKNIDDLDKAIKSLHKKYNGNNKVSQEEIFHLKEEESSIDKEIEKLEIKLG